ncbi:hypothetical protein [Shimia sp. R9_3]|uniref:acylneuraminate cytidylyltransferase family protein n=1 Tax=Shimia sp. R9_3 TaxID=2821113 RepID=UPI001AD96EF3|nr:hypothetical protein [Shimia sp. R9_3]MBO9399407.1 hypothetical protein [Shimia sp. R9_3]
MKIVAVVPVKEKSDRVVSKNFREFFGGKSLFELKLSQLHAADCFDEIYVSSDYTSLADRQSELGFTFIERDVEFCDNVKPWPEVIHQVAASLPEDDETSVAWCHTTSPLFDEYSKCVAAYQEKCSGGDYDGLVAVKKISEFLVSEMGLPINYAWGPWHKYSQHLPKTFAVNGALFITKKEMMVRNRYVVSPSPYFYETDDVSSVDVDTDLDFEYAQFLMQRKL